MDILLDAQSLGKSFGSRWLFRELSLSLFSGARVGLIGPNGSGKTTLLKILAGLDHADEGTLSLRRGLRIGYVPQTCEFGEEEPRQILLTSFAKEDVRSDYEKEVLVDSWLHKLGFTGRESKAHQLSGGWKKRLSLAHALISSPDLLLLDEPTNHLDLEGILWLEQFLKREVPSFLLVSHDRYFLQHMIDRTIEVNPVYPEGLFSVDGPYLQFLEKKELFLQGQLEQQRSMASKARKELDWLRRSPAARTSKSKSRVDEAHLLLQELAQIQGRNTKKKAGIDFAGTHRETVKLLVAKNLSKTVGERLLFSHLDFTLSPGTRMGLMGPNGSGKTTLLRMIAGELNGEMGTIKRADDLKIVYFDQHREIGPPSMTLKEAMAPKGDFVHFRGQMIHVNGWCKRFLFPVEALQMPIACLSGGERARIAIAHLMLQPADILLLDEPTNDLDIPTLEILEESLLEFPGAVVLITHDRCLLDRVCNTLLMMGNLQKNDFFADYAQWERAQEISTLEKEKTGALEKVGGKAAYQQKKEIDQIESKINRIEKQIQQLHLALEDPSIADRPETLESLCSEIRLLENQLEQLYLRWESLQLH